MAITFTNILVGEGVISLGATEGSAADLGATQEGASISWEPDMVDIEIDQFGDAARVVQSKVKVSLKTTLAEATLENLRVAWGYASTNIVAGAGIKTFSFGLHSVYPEEHFIQIVGTAPGSTASVTRTRTYKCRRCIQYAASEHTLKRAENIAFPVEFRLLPDPQYTGAEYGTIVDTTA